MEFLDTNVLVYAASQRTADQNKASIARDLLRRGPGELAISLQVLQEFYVAARAPRKLALAHRPGPEKRVFWIADRNAEYPLSALTTCKK